MHWPSAPYDLDGCNPEAFSSPSVCTLRCMHPCLVGLRAAAARALCSLWPGRVGHGPASHLQSNCQGRRAPDQLGTKMKGKIGPALSWGAARAPRTTHLSWKQCGCMRHPCSQHTVERSLGCLSDACTAPCVCLQKPRNAPVSGPSKRSATRSAQVPL